MIGHKDELDYPYGLVYDGTGDLIISDMWNDRVSVYGAQEGKLERHVLGGETAERGKLKFTRPAFVSFFSLYRFLDFLTLFINNLRFAANLVHTYSWY